MERSEWIVEMVDCLATEEVDLARLTKAIDLKYQNRPKSVFKYREMDACGYSLQNLQNDRVWVCSPTSYNDPYDSGLSVSIDVLIEGVIRDGVKKIAKNDTADQIDVEELSRILKPVDPRFALQELITAKYGLSEKAQTILREWLTVLTNEYRRKFTDISAYHKQSLKICSFSETPESIIMWSHYADQHKGFCIEYGLDDLPATDMFVRMIYPVVYSENLFDGTRYWQAFIRDRTNANLQFPSLAALYKSPEWSYEREWRLIIPANLVTQATSWRVPKPKAIYLGSLMPEAKKAEVIEICRRKGIAVFQMSLAPETFCMRSDLILKADEENSFDTTENTYIAAAQAPARDLKSS